MAVLEGALKMSASQTATGNPRANDGARASDEEILGLPTATKATPAARAKTPRAVQSRTILNSSAVGASAAPESARASGIPPDRHVPASAKSSAPAHESPTGADPLDSSSYDVGASNASPAETDRSTASVTAEEPEDYRAIFDANPDLRDAWHSAQAYREIFRDIEQARALQKIFPTPADAERATAQLAELDRLDSMFFSNRPESLAELAAIVYRLNPDAFANLTRVMVGMTNNATAAPRHKELSSPGDRNLKTAEAGAQHAASDSAATPASPETLPARTAFFEDTNAATVEGVVQVIESQVDRLLPEGISPGARNRVVGEVYRELDATLRGNRALARQVREAFRSGALDTDHQRAIVGMVVGRARQALPGIAKKVIEEWTSSVLAASSARLARQRTAERRVDIAGAGPAASEVRRPLSPSDLDYAKLSDADILNL
jgi:hypothetical protein